MRRKLAFLAILAFSLMLVSGCDSVPPLDDIVQTTSIVGQIGNINKENTQFVIKAYLQRDPDVMISKATADENGYFQIILSESGSYILKIDYTFKEKTMEYIEPHTYDEKKIKPINVNKDKITNVGIIYTSLEDVYLHKIIQELEQYSEFKYSATVEPNVNLISKGIKLDSPKIMFRPLGLAMIDPHNENRSKFKYLWETLENDKSTEIIIALK